MVEATGVGPSATPYGDSSRVWRDVKKRLGRKSRRLSVGGRGGGAEIPDIRHRDGHIRASAGELGGIRAEEPGGRCCEGRRTCSCRFPPGHSVGRGAGPGLRQADDGAAPRLDDLADH